MNFIKHAIWKCESQKWFFSKCEFCENWESWVWYLDEMRIFGFAPVVQSCYINKCHFERFYNCSWSPSIVLWERLLWSWSWCVILFYKLAPFESNFGKIRALHGKEMTFSSHQLPTVCENTDDCCFLKTFLMIFRLHSLIYGSIRKSKLAKLSPDSIYSMPSQNCSSFRKYRGEKFAELLRRRSSNRMTL